MYYIALQLFAATLLENNILKPKGPWTLRVLLEENSARDEVVETVALLTALGCEVVYSSLSLPYEYSTARYLIHDAPDVDRYLVLDGHYWWNTTDQIKRFKEVVQAWVDSGSPVMAARYKAEGSKVGNKTRNFAGGWFGGVPGSSPLQRGHMVEELKWWFAKAGAPYQASARGEDEEFLNSLVEQLQVVSPGTVFLLPFCQTAYNTVTVCRDMGGEWAAKERRALRKKLAVVLEDLRGLPHNWEPTQADVKVVSTKRRRLN
jgi:hypothetical protein